MPLRVFWWRCSRHYAIFEFTGSWSIESKHEFWPAQGPCPVDLVRVLPQHDTSLWLLGVNLAYIISSSNDIPRPTETEETMSTCKCQGEGDKDAEIFASKVKFGPQRAKHSGHGCCGADCCWVVIVFTTFFGL